MAVPEAGGSIHLFGSTKWEACGSIVGGAAWGSAQLSPHHRCRVALAFSGLQSPPR